MKAIQKGPTKALRLCLPSQKWTKQSSVVERYHLQCQKIGQDRRYILQSGFFIAVLADFEAANIMYDVWAFGKKLSEIGSLRIETFF